MVFIALRQDNDYYFVIVVKMIVVRILSCFSKNIVLEWSRPKVLKIANVLSNTKFSLKS